MKYFITFFLATIFAYTGLSQTDLSESIEIKVNKYNQAYYEHRIQKNETLYSLAKYFKVPLSDLLLVNDMRKGDNVPLGTTIVIPIKTSEIHTSISKKDAKWKPLVYVVKNKETLYRISNVYFPQKIEDLISRNNISSFALSRGRKLIVGYWGEQQESKVHSDISERIKDQIKKKLQSRKTTDTNSNPSERPVRIEVVEQQIEEEIDSILSEIVLEDEAEVQTDSIGIIEEADINYTTGIASWDKAGNDRENLFVMHSAAKPNSYIKLRYPLTGKEVTAQVLCPIPKNVFADDISIVISPAVANALGALDSRFQIQMHYYK